MSIPSYEEQALRLVLAVILGGIIGYERQSRHKSAGLRTNILVCLGSCLIMMMSEEIYVLVEGRTNADPARLVAQVVSGIGFLGAGAIMKEGFTVVGLTTAACLWVVAGVGIAVGGGYYFQAVGTTALVFLVLGILSSLDDRVPQKRNLSILLEVEERPRQLGRITARLESLHLQIHGVHVQQEDDEPSAMQIRLEVYNRRDVGTMIIAEALREMEGVLRVEIA